MRIQDFLEKLLGKDSFLILDNEKNRLITVCDTDWENIDQIQKKFDEILKEDGLDNSA